MTKTTHYDAIVIGTGQSGPALAARLAKEGRKTAILERKRFGGTCVNVGCVPTKALVASARAAYIARRAADFGVVIDGAVSVDMARIKARKDAIVKHSTEGVENWLVNTRNLAVIRGHGRFMSAKSIAVNDDVLSADQIFINVGGRATVPPLPGLADVPYLTNSTMMDVDFLPEHLLVIGGSYIGLEFAQIYRRFGSRVTVFEHGPRIISREDEPLSAAVHAILVGEGIDIRCNATNLAVAKGPDTESVVMSFGEPASRQEIVGSHLLLAVGRVPNTDDLGLDRAGIATDARGFIVVDDKLQTNVPGVWALGDANGRGAFTHTSYNDFEIVAANLFDNDTRRVSDRIPVYALFIDPPLARIGLNEREVRARGRPALVAKMPMARVGRARERSETQGYMQVWVDAESKKILGASLLGIEADEVIHCLLDVMSAGAPYTVIQRTMHIHPTVSELIPTLFGLLRPMD